MEDLTRLADPSLFVAGLIPCQAAVTVKSGETVLARSDNAFSTAWPEANGSLLVPEGDVDMTLLLEAGRDAQGLVTYCLAGGDDGGAAVAWRHGELSPSGQSLIGFDRKVLHIAMADRRPGYENGVSTVDRFPRWGDITELVDLMDVEPQPDGSFEAPTFGNVRRNVVEGGQLLGDTVVAAARTDPDKRVVSAHVIFSRPAVFDRTMRLDVKKSRMGRSFDTLTVETSQGGKPIATGVVLMDAGAEDLIRHDAQMPDVAGPEAGVPYDFGLIGRELRIIDGAYSPDPDRVSPPEIHAWMRYRWQPDDLCLRQAVLGQPTTHWTIAASMLPHKGYGEVMAHRTISTGVLSATMFFHEDADLTDWLLYTTRATYAGRGLAQGEGRIYTRSGALVGTYSSQVMVRAIQTVDGMKDDRLM